MIQHDLFQSQAEIAARVRIHERIDDACRDATRELAAMSEAAIKHINYSVGQRIRRMRERIYG